MTTISVRNPYSSTIEALIDTLRQLDEDISDALAEMHVLHEEVLILTDENARIKREGYGQTNYS